MKCLCCHWEHENKVLDLGKIYHSVYLNAPEDIKKLEPQELALIKCPSCDFVQLSKILEPDSLYREYFYRSDANNSMVHDLNDVHTGIFQNSLSPIIEGDIAVDIGCNTGVLTSFYGPAITTVGFDPANNLKEQADKNCTHFINDYFSADEYNKRFNKKAKVVSAIACFYDMPDPNKFLEDVVSILADDGLLVIQMTDYTSMLSCKAFDNICFEHLGYFTLTRLDDLFFANSLRIIKVEYNQVNGGSIRVYATHSFMKPKDEEFSVSEALRTEKEFLEKYPLSMFASDIIKSGRIVTDFIKKEKGRGKSIFALGASTKGSVLLQVFGLTSKEISLCLEINKDKFDKYWSAGGIRIINENGVSWYSDYALVLPWHFKPNILKKYADYINRGGSFIFPLPEPTLVNKNGEFPL